MRRPSSVKLKNLPISIIDGDRSAKYPKRTEFIGQGIPFLNSTNITNGRLDLSELNYISEEKFSTIRKGRAQHGDIVMTTRGSIGKVAYIPIGFHGLINAQMLIFRAEENLISNRYFFYWLLSNDAQTGLKNFSSGSAQPQIPIRDLQEIELPVPPLCSQRCIAGILSTYDDLIENNARRIAILEEMAQLIYEEWFINYRFPGHESMPLVESELGPVPEGWDVVSAADAVEVNPKVKVPKEGAKPFVPMGCLSAVNMLISNIETRAGNSGTKFQNGDTLFARITPCLENGKTAYVQFLPSPESVAFGSTEFIVLRSRKLTPEFVYLLARSEDFRNNAIKSMAGADGRQRVKEACFASYMLAHPDAATLQKFHGLVHPMFDMIHVLARKNENLRQTRDLLLPRLISGELDVSAFPMPEDIAA